MNQQELYSQAMVLFRKEQYYSAMELFSKLGGYKDSAERARDCREKLKEISEKREKQIQAENTAQERRIKGGKQKKRWTRVIRICLVCVSAAFLLTVGVTHLVRLEKERGLENQVSELLAANAYDDALALTENSSERNAGELTTIILYAKADGAFEDQRYEEAAQLFTSVSFYSDAMNRAKECRYRIADGLFAAGEYEQAAEAFSQLSGYSDAGGRAQDCRYRIAEGLFEAGEYEQAAEAFSQLSGYSDASDRAKDCRYRNAEGLFEAGKYEQAAEAFRKLGNYSDADARRLECLYRKAEVLLENGDYPAAAVSFESAEGFSDAEIRAKDAWFEWALQLYAQQRYDDVYPLLKKIGDYRGFNELPETRQVRLLHELQQGEGKYLLSVDTYQIGQDFPAGAYTVCQNNRNVDTLLITYIAPGASDTDGITVNFERNKENDRFFIHLEEGSTLQVLNTAAYLCVCEPPDLADGRFGTGLWRVGKDLPAGEYSARTEKKTGTVSVYSQYGNREYPADAFGYTTDPVRLREGEMFFVDRPILLTAYDRETNLKEFALTLDSDHVLYPEKIIHGDGYDLVESYGIIQGNYKDGYHLCDLNGNAISKNYESIDTGYYQSDFLLTTANDRGCHGVIKNDGTEVISPAYDRIEITGDWALAYLYTSGIAENEPETPNDSEPKEPEIQSVSLFHLRSGKHLADFSGPGDVYLNETSDYVSVSMMDVDDRTELFFTLDGEKLDARPQRTGTRDGEVIWESGGERMGLTLTEKGKALLDGMDSSGLIFGDNKNGYRELYDGKNREHTVGLVSESLDVVFPMEYDEILYVQGGHYTRFETCGIFAAVRGSTLTMNAGGKLTEIQLNQDRYYELFLGTCVAAVSQDQSWTLYDPDGTPHALPKGCEFLSPVFMPDGTVYFDYYDFTNYFKVLVDDHGNPLITAKDLTVTGDGHLITNDYIRGIVCIYDLAGID